LPDKTLFCSDLVRFMGKAISPWSLKPAPRDPLSTGSTLSRNQQVSSAHNFECALVGSAAGAWVRVGSAATDVRSDEGLTPSSVSAVP